MRPADEIFMRLKWDSDCSVQPPANVTIGYEDRFLGILETTIGEFEHPDADIPFHRIRYFKTRDTGHVFWDRRTRVDLLTSGHVAIDGTAATTTTTTQPAPSEPSPQAAKRSGKQKKQMLKEMRLAKREDEKTRLVEQLGEEEEIEQEQARLLAVQLANVQRQQRRIAEGYDSDDETMREEDMSLFL